MNIQVETIHVANGGTVDAIRDIAKVQKLSDERDAWKACAGKLADQLGFLSDSMGQNFPMDGDTALAEFHKLKVTQ